MHHISLQAGRQALLGLQVLILVVGVVRTGSRRLRSRSSEAPLLLVSAVSQQKIVCDGGMKSSHTATRHRAHHFAEYFTLQRNAELDVIGIEAPLY